MAKGYGLGEVDVKPQGTCDCAGDLGDLDGVGEAGAIVVSLRRQEDLRLVGEPPEALAV